MSFPVSDGTVECNNLLCYNFYDIDGKNDWSQQNCILFITEFALLIMTYFYLSFRFIAKGESGGEARFVYLQVSIIYLLLENYLPLNVKAKILKKVLFRGET